MGSQEGLILALRAEVERLKHKCNAVVSSAEVTLREVQEENDAVRLSFIKKEELYHREVREREREMEHYKSLYMVTRDEYELEQRRYQEANNMLQALREATLHSTTNGGMSEMKTDDADTPSSSSSSSSSLLAHPGQLILRSTNSWAIEVNKLRRTTAKQAADLEAQGARIAQMSRELEDQKTLLSSSRAEAVKSLALLDEFRLAQAALGKPRTRDQQLLSTIRAALDSSNATTSMSRSTIGGSRAGGGVTGGDGALLAKDLLATCSDEETVQAQHAALFQQSLDELKEVWDASSDCSLDVMLARLTEKLAESRAQLIEKTEALEGARRTLDKQIADKETVLQHLAEEHEHAAHWVREKHDLEAQLAEISRVHAEELVAKKSQFEQSLNAFSERCKNELEASERERLGLALHNSELENLLADMNSQCEEQQGRLLNLDSELKEMRLQAKADATKAFEDVYGLTQELSQANAKYRESENQTDDFKRRLASLEGDFSTQSQGWETTKAALQAKKDELQTVSQELAALRSEFLVVKTSNETRQTKVQHLSSCIDAHWREMDDLKRTLSQANEDKATLERLKDSLQSRLAECDGEIAAQTSTIAQLTNNLASVNEELEIKTCAMDQAIVAHVAELLQHNEVKANELSVINGQLSMAQALAEELKRQARETEANWTKTAEKWTAENNKLYAETQALLAENEAAALVSAGKVSTMESQLASAKRQEEQAIRDAKALQASLKISADRIEATNDVLLETRTTLEITQLQLNGKIDELLELSAANHAMKLEHRDSCAALESNLSATNLRLADKEREANLFREKALALQKELDELKPGIQELLQESEQSAKIANQLRAARELVEEKSSALQILQEEKAELESQFRLENDIVTARICEMQSQFETKEKRLKEIVSFAKENIKKLEADAIQRDKDHIVKLIESDDKHTEELVALQTKFNDEARLRRAAEDDKAFSERQEQALTEQLRALQERHTALQTDYHIKELESSKQMSLLAEKLRTSDLQAKYHERQAGSSAEEFIKRDGEIRNLQETCESLTEDLLAARQQFDAMMKAQVAERERFLEDMEDLRDKHSAELSQTFSEVSLDFERSSRIITEQLWESERAKAELEARLIESSSELHQAKMALVVSQEQLAQEVKDRLAEQNEHKEYEERLRIETSKAMQEQLESQSAYHAAELAAANASQLAEMEKLVKAYSDRDAELDDTAKELANQTLNAKQLAEWNAQLQEQYNEALANASKMSKDLTKASDERVEDREALQLEYDKAKYQVESLQQERDELAVEVKRLLECVEKTRREDRKLTDVLLSDVDHTNAEARRRLESENASLSLTLAQVRNEMLVMLKNHLAELELTRVQYEESQNKSWQDREEEVFALRREAREATERWAELKVGSAAQERSRREEHENEIHQAKARMGLLQDQVTGLIATIQAAEVERQQSLEELAATLKLEAETAVASEQKKLADYKRESEAALFAEQQRLVQVKRETSVTIAVEQQKRADAEIRLQGILEEMGANANKSAADAAEQLQTLRAELNAKAAEAQADFEKQLHSLRAEVELKAAETERDRSKLAERALAARRDQHAALEAHERALAGALSAADAQKQLELAAARDIAQQAQMQLQAKLHSEVQLHSAAMSEAEAQIKALNASLDALQKEAAAHQHLHAELLSESQREAAAAREAADAAEQDTRRAREEFTAERESLSVTLQQRDAEIASLQHRLSKHETANRDFVTSVAQLQRHVEESEATSKVALERLADARSELEGLHAAKAAAAASASELAAAATAAVAAIPDAATERTVAALRQDLEMSRAETEALSASLAASESQARQAAENYSRKISALEARLLEAKNTLESRSRESPFTSALSHFATPTPMKGTSVVEPLTASAFLSPLRRLRAGAGGARGGASELDDSPLSSPSRAAPGPSLGLGAPSQFDPITPFRTNEESTQADEQMTEIRAILAAADVVSAKPASELESLLRQSVASYDTLKALHLQAEHEYNAAARILIDAAEANRVKLHTRMAQCQRKLDQTTALYSKIKVKLVNERLEYREELENLRLRLLSGSAHIEGDSFESDDSFQPSPNSSRSDSPSTFSVLTDQLED